MINMSPSCVGIALLFLDTLKYITLSHCRCFFSLTAQHLMGLDRCWGWPHTEGALSVFL